MSVRESIPAASLIQKYQLFSGYGYSIGRHREKNQDTIFTYTTTLATNNQETPIGLYIVADGMGGHELGEVASNAAARTAAGVIFSQIVQPLMENRPDLPDIEDTLRLAVSQARDSVIAQAPEGGTTLTLALILGGFVYIAHIGDSRAYFLHGREYLEVITRDHSLVKRLEELGQITSEEAAVHPQRNVLYRALGQGEQTEAEITRHTLPSNGYLILCSDGLWGVISSEQFIKTIRETSHPVQACNQLISLANEAGGPDNISMILVQIIQPGTAA